MEPIANKEEKLAEAMDNLGYTKDEAIQCVKVLNNSTVDLLEKKKAVLENAASLVSKRNGARKESEQSIGSCHQEARWALETASQLDIKIQESIYSETQLGVIREIQKMTEDVKKELAVPSSPDVNPNLVLIMKTVDGFLDSIFYLLVIWIFFA